MFQREVSVADVRQALETGESIVAYPHDRPHPSRLVLGWAGPRPLHIVAADDPDNDITVVITVYEPDPALREPDFRTRRP